MVVLYIVGGLLGAILLICLLLALLGGVTWLIVAGASVVYLTDQPTNVTVISFGRDLVEVLLIDSFGFEIFKNFIKEVEVIKVAELGLVHFIQNALFLLCNAALAIIGSIIVLIVGILAFIVSIFILLYGIFTFDFSVMGIGLLGAGLGSLVSLLGPVLVIIFSVVLLFVNWLVVLVGENVTPLYGWLMVILGLPFAALGLMIGAALSASWTFGGGYAVGKAIGRIFCNLS